MEEMKRNISFLEQTSELINQWANRQYYSSTKFTPDTLNAVQLTSSTIAKAIPDIYMSKTLNWGIDYICTAKLNSDHAEGAFGRCCQIAGTNYWTQVRQFLDAETMIRTHCLVKLSGYKLKDIKHEMKSASEVLKLADELLCDELIQELYINSDSLDPEKMEAAEAGEMCHFSGYLAQKAQ